MTYILIDTNIILDIALKREPFFTDSYNFFLKLDNKLFTGFITATTVADIYYIAKRQKGHEVALDFLKSILQIVDVKGVNKESITNALNSSFSDFEDAIQHYSAKQFEIGIIVTRNIDDFKESDLEIITPSDFLKKFE